jgi:hypothetical protein
MNNGLNEAETGRYDKGLKERLFKTGIQFDYTTFPAVFHIQFGFVPL